ncbi:hypothetical protein [Trinickia symbiotica]|nr:hypothetical protein [Trinickia symbiotica]
MTHVKRLDVGHRQSAMRIDRRCPAGERIGLDMIGVNAKREALRDADI